MKQESFTERLATLNETHEEYINRPNAPLPWNNGIYQRYVHPVLTAGHAPPFWRYDLDPERNPYLMERLGINAAFNAGAMELNGRIVLMARIEGWDRKSFFAVAESPNGIDRFRFWDYPVVMTETDDPDINVYDMRLVKHEDGWIYGIFCTERRDPKAAPGDLSSAMAQAGIGRTRDLVHWQRLPDLKSRSPQQRNVVLHPEFVDGQYAFYTRPQDDFISAGRGGGIGWALCPDITNPVVDQETIIDQRLYHTIKESKNGLGPAPIKTPQGWLQLAHGVRSCAAGLRYVLYLFLTDLKQPDKVLYAPGGYFIAPQAEERVGDVSNVVFSNGWVARENGDVLMYYASSDTRMHVATSTVDRLLDYVRNTPQDPLRSAACVQQRYELISRNLAALKTAK